MADTQAKEEVSKVVPLTFSDMIWLNIQETNKRMDRLENRQEKLEEKIDKTRQELNARMDKLETRMDKLDEKIDTVRQELNARMDKLDEKIDTVRQELNARMDKQDAKIDKLAEKIDKLADKMDSSNKHGNLMTASVIGIALAVIYAVFFK